jgi:hypothetical protein
MEQFPLSGSPANETVEQQPNIIQLKPGESEVKEDRVFSEAELFQAFEELDGIKPEDLTTIKKVMNEKGEIVSWELSLKEEVAQERFKSSVIYSFVLKGTHQLGRKHASTIKLTTIGRDYDNFGDTLAEYIDGQWKKQ